jgi:D-lactate dehydrogenase
MRIAVFSAKSYDRESLTATNAEDKFGHELTFLEPRLSEQTASLAHGFPAVCVFVNDCADHLVLQTLARGGTRLLALRCAGFNQVDLSAAKELGITVVRVPAYSPYATAEHSIALMLALNRKIVRANARTREGNFSIEGLLGFDMHAKTAGVIGTGKIGAIVCGILHGFGCRLLAYDVVPNADCERLGVRYVQLPELYAESDIITLHCPLTPQTRHLINAATLQRMKAGVMLINASRGAMIDTRAVIEALKSGKIGYLGLDVYEEEENLFYEDRSLQGIPDDVFARLLTFPNVLITGHQAYFTREALRNIATTTLANIRDIEQGRPCPNAVTS